MDARPGSDDRWRQGFLGVVAFAFVLRVGLALAQDGFPYWPDGEYYRSIARNLVAQGEYRNAVGPFPQDPLQSDVGPTSFWLPGYPLLLAAIFWLFGESARVLFLVQALLGTGAVALTGALGRRLEGWPVATTAAALVAVSPLQLYQVVRVASEGLATLLFIALAWLLVRILDEADRRRLRWREIALLGLLGGIGIASRSAFVPVAVTAVLLLAVRVRARLSFRRAAAAVGLALLLTSLVMLPWLVRNWTVWGGELVYQTKSGVNLMLGFNDFADGRYATARVPDLYRTDLDELARNDLLAARARAWILEHPAAAAGLAAKKLVMFFSPFHDRHGLSTAQGLFTFLWCAPLLVAAAMNACFVLASRRVDWLAPILLTLAWAATHAAAFYATRFRGPVEPVLALLAAGGGVAVVRRLRGARTPSGGASA